MPTEYYHTKESVQEYIKLAQGVDGRQLIEKLKKYLPKKASVLELGSGPGTDWQILSTNFATVGSDNSEVFLDHLHNSYPGGTFMHLDAATLKTEKTFDGIYANKVLHHLTNKELIKSIARQRDILHKQGILCHSFWKGEGSETFNGMFVNYHTKDELRNFFEPQFEILQLSTYAEFEEGDSLVLIAKRKD